MTTIATETREGYPQPANWWWVAASVCIAVLLGRELVVQTKVALSVVVLFVGVVVPLLVIGLRLRLMVLLLLGVLFLGPEIEIAPDLPRLIGDEAILYVTGILMLLDALSGDRVHSSTPMPAAGRALLMFFPLTLLTMVNGAARFGINPVRSDYFEFFKFGKYALALYVASQVRIDRGFLSKFSWGVAGGGFIAAATAILQAFNVFGLRSFFQLVYYSGNTNKIDEILSSRVAGTIGNPNELALFVAAGLAFSIMLFHWTKRPEYRLLLVGFFLTDAAAILLSGSRMGLVATVLVVALGLLRHSGRTALFGITVSSSVLLLAIVVLSVAEANNTLPRSVSEVLHPLFNRVERFSPRHLLGVAARFQMWQTAWTQTQASLLLGYGPAKGAFFLLTSTTVDSEVFIVILRYGLVGLLVWVAIWTTFLKTARRASRAAAWELGEVGYVLWSVLLINLLASVVNYTFLAVRRMTLVCLFVGVSAAIVRADRLARRQAGNGSG